MHGFEQINKLTTSYLQSFFMIFSMAFHLSVLVTPYLLFTATISLLLIAFTTILLYVFGSVFSFCIFYAKESFQKAADRPPIAGTVFHELIYFDTLFDFETNLARKHRTFRLMRPGHSEIFTADPANVEHMLNTNFSNYTKGKYNNDIMGDLFGEGIFAVDGEKWRQQRKLASYEFSTKVLREFSSVVFRTNGAKLAKKIAEYVSCAAVFDMKDLLMKSTLDSIFKVGFGTEIDTLSGSDELGSRFSKAFDDSSYIVFRRYVDAFWKIKRYLNMGLEAQLKKNIKLIDDYVYQLIRRKRELMKIGKKDGEKEDILSRFIIESEKDREEMSDKYLRDIILNFLIAGKDTTANTLSWFFYMICKHPFIQEKIVLEVRDATEAGGIGVSDIRDFAMGLITEKALDQMHYLHATLTETLRLYPAVPVDGKSAEEDDILPDGYKVKKGDGLVYMAYAMGRMTNLWGQDAEEFRPERWLHNGSFRSESPFKFAAFHAGPRICLGKEFAYRQMKIVASILLRFFKFKLADESKSATYRTMFTLQIDKGLPLLASPRCKLASPRCK